jgi:DNA-binding MarR family transcriptional regulator
MLLDHIDIYPGQPPLLMALDKQDGLSQKELADMMRIKPATMTMMVKRMESSGLIERKVDEEDQRKYKVYLTDKGKDKFLQVNEVNKKIENECFYNFSEEEKIIMRRLMIQMYENLESLIDQECERMEKHD